MLYQTVHLPSRPRHGRRSGSSASSCAGARPTWSRADNARAAVEAMVVGRREREEGVEFLESYLADRAHRGVGAQVPRQRRR